MTIAYPTATQVDYSPFPATRIEPVRKHWLRRFFVALAEARMRQAERELARHRNLLPAELQIAGDKLNRRNEDELPFVR